jgi:hypothetical protein
VWQLCQSIHPTVNHACTLFCPLCPRLSGVRDLLKRHLRLAHPSVDIAQEYPGKRRGKPRATPSPRSSLRHTSIPQDVNAHPLTAVPATALHSIPNVGYGSQQINPGFLDNGSQYAFPNDLGVIPYDPFASNFGQDFSSFMDSVPSHVFPYSITSQPLPILVWDRLQADPAASAGRESRQRLITLPPLNSLSIPAPSPSSPSRCSSLLPSLGPDTLQEVSSANYQPPPRPVSRDLSVSAECRQSVLEQLNAFPGCVPGDFGLPSRHTLSRLVGSFFQNFHSHYPFFHVPTLQMETLTPELLLAIAALGARYTRESDISVELYRVSMAVAMERLSRRPISTTQSDSSIEPGPAYGRAGGFGTKAQAEVVDLLQTLLVLMSLSSWYKHEPAVQDALSLRSIIHSLAQENAIIEKQNYRQMGWEVWIRVESTKRIILVIYCVLNVHTILFDVPPIMLPQELQFGLPCIEQEWRAETEVEWRTFSAGVAPQGFPDTYSALLTGDVDPSLSTSGFSALGGSALIHAVIQKTWLVRNRRIPPPGGKSHDLFTDEMNAFDNVLKRWTNLWQSNQESSVDPLNPHGPQTFTSMALLRLAYIRVNMDLGPVRALDSWDANIVAQSLHQSPGAQRGDHMTRAALHCAHALSILIKLGISYVAHTQVHRWSNQHALCSLECAVLLAKWLEAVTTPETALSPSEQKVLEFIAQLVAETEYKTRYEQILGLKHQLSSRVVRLWAKLYQADSVWQMVNLIGDSLNIYANLLEVSHWDIQSG